VQFFGQPPNLLAAPGVDVSGTGQTNLFKYAAGLDPLDPNSRFTLTIAPVPDPGPVGAVPCRAKESDLPPALRRSDLHGHGDAEPAPSAAGARLPAHRQTTSATRGR